MVVSDMLKRSHFLIGAAAGIAVADLMDLPFVVGAVTGGLAALAPDVDHPGSVVGKLLPRWWHRLTPGHRGPTHSLAWCALLGLLVALFQRWATGEAFAWAGSSTLVFAGSLSHVLADALTTHGVPFLYPLTRRKWRPLGALSFDTASWAEAVVTMAVLGVALAFVGRGLYLPPDFTFLPQGITLPGGITITR
jgi:inner membrane protein